MLPDSNHGLREALEYLTSIIDQLDDRTAGLVKSLNKWTGKFTKPQVFTIRKIWCEHNPGQMPPWTITYERS